MVKIDRLAKKERLRYKLFTRNLLLTTNRLKVGQKTIYHVNTNYISHINQKNAGVAILMAICGRNHRKAAYGLVTMIISNPNI